MPPQHQESSSTSATPTTPRSQKPPIMRRSSTGTSMEKDDDKSTKETASTSTSTTPTTPRSSKNQLVSPKRSSYNGVVSPKWKSSSTSGDMSHLVSPYPLKPVTRRGSSNGRNGISSKQARDSSNLSHLISPSPLHKHVIKRQGSSGSDNLTPKRDSTVSSSSPRRSSGGGGGGGPGGSSRRVSSLLLEERISKFESLADSFSNLNSSFSSEMGHIEETTSSSEQPPTPKKKKKETTENSTTTKKKKQPPRASMVVERIHKFDQMTDFLKNHSEHQRRASLNNISNHSHGTSSSLNSSIHRTPGGGGGASKSARDIFSSPQSSKPKLPFSPQNSHSTSARSLVGAIGATATIVNHGTVKPSSARNLFEKPQKVVPTTKKMKQEEIQQLRRDKHGVVVSLATEYKNKMDTIKRQKKQQWEKPEPKPSKKKKTKRKGLAKNKRNTAMSVQCVIPLTPEYISNFQAPVHEKNESQIALIQQAMSQTVVLKDLGDEKISISSPTTSTTASTTTTTMETTSSVSSTVPILQDNKDNNQDDSTTSKTTTTPLTSITADTTKSTAETLVKAMEHITVKHGEVIVQQGHAGEHFYIVEEGQVDFHVDGMVIGTAEAGTSFWDLNLLYSAAQSATVVAASKPTKLFRVDQQTYRGIMATTSSSSPKIDIEPILEEVEEETPLLKTDEDSKEIVVEERNDDDDDVVMKTESKVVDSTVVVVEDKGEEQQLSSFMQQRAAIHAAVQSSIGLDDLERISVLGEGQFGEVWLVQAEIEGEAHRFALKSQQKEDDIRAENTEDAIRQEMEMLRQLQHPFMCELVHTYEDEPCLYMLLGLITGGELWDLIHQEDADGNWTSGLSSEYQAQFYALAIADTLTFMHDKRYIFRDLKPENVMMDGDGYPVIVDFGFAKQLPVVAAGAEEAKTFTFCGTPNYVAPEIVKNTGHNASADHWALGVVIYEMLSGENPFYYDGMDTMALFQAICEEPAYAMSEGQASDTASKLMEKLLAKDASERLGSTAMGGPNGILQHEWFDGLDLEKLRRKELEAPWIPGSAPSSSLSSPSSPVATEQEEKDLMKAGTLEKELAMDGTTSGPSTPRASISAVDIGTIADQEEALLWASANELRPDGVYSPEKKSPRKNWVVKGVVPVSSIDVGGESGDDNGMSSAQKIDISEHGLPTISLHDDEGAEDGSSMPEGQEEGGELSLNDEHGDTHIPFRPEGVFSPGRMSRRSWKPKGSTKSAPSTMAHEHPDGQEQSEQETGQTERDSSQAEEDMRTSANDLRPDGCFSPLTQSPRKSWTVKGVVPVTSNNVDSDGGNGSQSLNEMPPASKSDSAKQGLPTISLHDDEDAEDDSPVPEGEEEGGELCLNDEIGDTHIPFRPEGVFSPGRLSRRSWKPKGSTVPSPMDHEQSDEEEQPAQDLNEPGLIPVQEEETEEEVGEHPMEDLKEPDLVPAQKEEEDDEVGQNAVVEEKSEEFHLESESGSLDASDCAPEIPDSEKLDHDTTVDSSTVVISPTKKSKTKSSKSKEKSKDVKKKKPKKKTEKGIQEGEAGGGNEEEPRLLRRISSDGALKDSKSKKRKSKKESTTTAAATSGDECESLTAEELDPVDGASGITRSGSLGTLNEAKTKAKKKLSKSKVDCESLTAEDSDPVDGASGFSRSGSLGTLQEAKAKAKKKFSESKIDGKKSTSKGVAEGGEDPKAIPCSRAASVGTLGDHGKKKLDFKSPIIPSHLKRKLNNKQRRETISGALGAFVDGDESFADLSKNLK